jgi:hypothetical protein
MTDNPAVKVRVQKIMSINDPGTGRPGKQIELVEVRQRGTQSMTFGVGDDESRIVRGLLNQFQSLGVFPQISHLVLPKVTLFLSEIEYDLLGIRFEVNDVYEVFLNDGSILLKKSAEGI